MDRAPNQIRLLGRFIHALYLYPRWNQRKIRCALFYSKFLPSNESDRGFGICKINKEQNTNLPNPLTKK